MPVGLDSPEAIPEVLLSEVQFWVAGDQAVRVGVVEEALRLDEFRPLRVTGNILRDILECFTLTFVFAQDVIVWLLL